MENLPIDEEKLLKKYKPTFAFAYGSAAYPQEGYKNEENPMIDFVFGVNFTNEWHRINLEKNTEDYSWLCKKLGVNFINWLQKKSAGIYYHPYIPFDGKEIKYGVIQMDRLCDDLKNWSSMYIAGRMQKPIRIIKSVPYLKDAMNQNLKSALSVALLLLPENFTEEDLYMKIAGLSYMGDSRMKVGGENPQKVQNIVRGNLEAFQNLYREHILKKNKVFASLMDGKMQQDKSPRTLKCSIQNVPQGVIGNFPKEINFESSESVANSISNAIKKTIAKSSTRQTIKALFTAGAGRSIRYVKEKRGKGKKT